MANTTNYNWETPDDTDLVKDGAAAIRTLGSSIDTTTKNLNPETTTGDIAYRSATANTNTRLAIGSTGQVLTVAAGVPSWATLSVQNPNLIINGNFTINQRGYTSGSNLASGAYGFDRWKSNYTNTTLTFTSEPAGQSVTISVDGVIRQIVERGNIPAGTYTLSWTGTATGRIYNSGSTPPAYAASPITFTADGAADVIVEYTAVSTTKTLSKVKLELGSNATAFNYSGGTLAGERSACERYYWKDSSAVYEMFINNTNDNLRRLTVSNPTTMRANGSYTITMDSGSATVDSITPRSARVYISKGNTTSTAYFTAIEVSAEL